MWLRYILTASPFKPLSPLGPWKIKMKEVTNKPCHWLLKLCCSLRKPCLSKTGLQVINGVS